MTTEILLLNLGILAFVLASGLGTRPLTRRRRRLPLLVAAAVGFVFLRTVPTAGSDVSLDVALGLAGVALGALAGGLMAVQVDPTKGSVVTRAATSYAALWTAVIGARVIFIYGSAHVFPRQIATFSAQHAITGAPAWTAALVIMAISMVVARVMVTGLKVRSIPATARQPLAHNHDTRHLVDAGR